MEEDLFQMMAGAALALKEANCPLLGGHSCEGVELSLGFSITGHVPEKTLHKGGLGLGDVLILTKPLGTGVLFAAQMRGAAPAGSIATALKGMVADVLNHPHTNEIIDNAV